MESDDDKQLTTETVLQDEQEFPRISMVTGADGTVVVKSEPSEYTGDHVTSDFAVKLEPSDQDGENVQVAVKIEPSDQDDQKNPDPIVVTESGHDWKPDQVKDEPCDPVPNGSAPHDSAPHDSAPNARRPRKLDKCCVACDFKAATIKDVISHLEHAHNRNRFQCRSCTFSSNRRPALFNHFRHKRHDKIDENIRHVSTRRITNSMVSLIYKTGYGMVFTCTVCNYENHSLDTMDVHTQCHQNRTCPHCEVCLHDTHAKMLHHIYDHGDAITGQCSMCPFKIKPWAQYTQLYNKQIDAMYLKFQEHSQSLPLFQCTLCGMCHNSRKYIKTHMDHEHALKLFKCKWCDHKSDWYSLMLAHVKSHQGSKRSLSCTECDFSTHTLYAYEEHRLTHTGVPPFNCTDCSFKSLRKIAVDQHTPMHSKSMPYKCDCGFTTFNDIQLRKHVIRVHNSSPSIKCNICNIPITNVVRYATHRRTHHREHIKAGLKKLAKKHPKKRAKKRMLLSKRNPTSYVRRLCKYKTHVLCCYLCSFSIIRNVHRMKAHLKMHKEKLALIQCPSCKYKTVDRKGLLRHISSHKVMGQTSEYCSPSIPDRPISSRVTQNSVIVEPTSRKRHYTRVQKADNVITTEHNLASATLAAFANQAASQTKESNRLKEGVNPASQLPARDKLLELAEASRKADQANRVSVYNLSRYRPGHMFKCNECHFETLKVAKLREHIVERHGRKRFACELCPFSCDRKYDMGRHMMTHTGEKPFSCEHCDYRCANKGQLTVHVRAHTGKPFKCKLCEFATTCASNLTRHMRGHTNERKFKCHLCSFSTTADRGQLNLHIRTHSEDMPLRCPICPFGARRPIMLKQHMDIEHGSGTATTYKCEKCNMNFFSSSSLVYHRGRCNPEMVRSIVSSLASGHDSSNSSSSGAQSEPSSKLDHRSYQFRKGYNGHVMQCEECDFSTLFIAAIAKHMQTEHDKELYQCDLCDFITHRELDIEEHMKTHPGKSVMSTEEIAQNTLECRWAIRSTASKAACTNATVLDDSGVVPTMLGLYDDKSGCSDTHADIDCMSTLRPKRGRKSCAPQTEHSSSGHVNQTDTKADVITFYDSQLPGLEAD